MTNKEAFERYIGKPVIKKICDDEFEFHSLPVEYYGEYFELVKKFTGKKPEELLDILNKEEINVINKLVLESMKQGTDADEDTLKKFISSNFSFCMNGMFEANIPEETKDIEVKKKVESIKNIKEKVAKNDNAKSTTGD